MNDQGPANSEKYLHLTRGRAGCAALRACETWWRRYRIGGHSTRRMLMVGERSLIDV